MSKYSEKIKTEARSLFLKNQSLNEIVSALRSRYSKACNGLHRSTVDVWVKKGGWEKDKARIAEGAIKKATSKLVDSFENELENYHAESYEMDSKLRQQSYKKLQDFIQNNPCDIYTVRVFADVFRISTANIVKLWEIAKGGKDDNPLLDELLKMRGNKNV